jgi:hypothetical protein
LLVISGRMLGAGFAEIVTLSLGAAWAARLPLEPWI